MNDHDTIAQLQQKRIILVASSGRCGTLLLSELLSLIPGVCAEHEPPPFVDNLWWRLRKQPELARTWLISYKLPAILKSFQDSDTATYVETSHMLCKGLFEPLLDLDIVFDLVVLSRDLRTTALSFHALYDIPIRSKSGRRWLPAPNDTTNISVLPEPYSQYSEYQLCYWYVLEMELRKALYYKTWTDAGRVVVRVDLKELISKSGFKSLLRVLSLPDPPLQAWHEYKLMAMTKHNAKSSRKSFMKAQGFTDAYVMYVEKQELMIRDAINYDELMSSIR